MGSKKKRSVLRKQQKQQAKKESNDKKNRQEREGGLNEQHRSLYHTYKASTEYVKQWGLDTWNKVFAKDDKKKKALLDGKSPDSLRSIIFKLNELATHRVPIPKVAWEHLQRAVRFRQEVGKFYRSVTNTTDRDLDGHYWIIDQLLILTNRFVVKEEEQQQTEKAVPRKSQKDAPDDNSHGASRKVPSYNVFRDEDDESSSEEEDDEESLGRAEHVDSFLSIPKQDDSPAPTDEEIRHEERTFAIACALAEVHQTRMDLRKLWSDWETLSSKGNDDTQAGELLGIVCACNYAVHMLRVTLLSTSMEFGFEFEEILKAAVAGKEERPAATSENGTNTTPTTGIHVPMFARGDKVVVQKMLREDLNGKQGGIVGTIREGRYPVRLDGDKKTYLIKPQNLGDADGTFLCIQLVYDRLSRFDFDALAYLDWDGEEAAPRLIELMDGINESEGDFEMARDRGWMPALIDLVVTNYLPLWFYYAKNQIGPADPVLRVYLREFQKTKKVTLHFAFLVLAIIDASIVTKEDGHTVQLVNRTLSKARDRPCYDVVIKEYHRRKLCPKWYCDHTGLIDIYIGVFSNLSNLLPWIPGDLLFDGLRLNLVATCCLPHDWQLYFTSMLHAYWMLRIEGHLDAIDELEHGLVGVYRQRSWFKSGLPSKGKGSFVSSWQYSLGANTGAVQALKGIWVKGAARGSHFLEGEGFHVTEISRLLDVMQWKSLPIFHRDSCLDKIRSIAREECARIFLAPILQCGIKLWGLEQLLGRGCMDEARKYIAQDEYTSRLTRKMTLDSFKVCFWCLSLADERLKVSQAEKHAGLTRVAQCFELAFRVKASSTPQERQQTEPVLNFNPNEHDVDDGLLGEESYMNSSYNSHA